ncbi:MAG: MBL fold metallo-hydrolase [Oscillospiraceae bacterium]|nr:MBL fold metallo-hydrolase [Oscillospiraceae bacterium]
MKKLFASLLLLCLLLTGCTAPNTQQNVDQFVVHFIDVGQADCALLEYNGQFVLIDGGYPESGPAVVEYLQEQGVEELALVVATHLHGDHLGGLPTVLSVFPTQRIWCSSRTYYSNTYDQFCYYADQQDVIIENPMIGEKLLLGNVQLQLLGPISKDYVDLNNTSLVIMATYENNKFLFTGDMRWEAEKELVEAGTDLKADVLKVGHHGSYTSSSYVFLREVMPEFAVISCGRNNEYGHPHAEPMSRLRDAGITIYRTDQMGTIIATSDGENISFTWEFANAQPEVNS